MGSMRRGEDGAVMGWDACEGRVGVTWRRPSEVVLLVRVVKVTDRVGVVAVLLRVRDRDVAPEPELIAAVEGRMEERAPRPVAADELLRPLGRLDRCHQRREHGRESRTVARVRVGARVRLSRRRVRQREKGEG